MAENGILDYQGMNQAIYRGATSNIVVDTQSMSIEIGAGNSSHTSNLHIECDHDANVASIQLNSNVVTEFPRSKKLIKYPRVALTSAAQSSAGDYEGYIVNQSSVYTSESDHGAYLAFRGNSHWLSSSNSFDGAPDRFNDVNGPWISIQLPTKIKLEYLEFSAASNRIAQLITAGSVYASNNGSTWINIGSLDNLGTYTNTAPAHVNFTHTTLYDRYLLHVTANTTSYNYVHMEKLSLFGIPEYDPDAHGTDVTVKSYPNVPNTDWLEVYYDAKGETTMPNPVTDLAGGDQDASVYGVTLDTTNEAFVFNGSSYLETDIPQITTGVWPFTMSFWFKVNAHIGSTWNYLAHLGIRGTHGDSTLVGLKNDRIAITTWGDSQIVSSFVPVPGVWYHVTSTWPGGPFYDNAKLYINAVSYGDSSGTRDETSPLSFPTSGNKLTLGKQMNTTSDYFDGSIANFRLFNRALTSDEIYQLYAYQKEYFGHGDLSMTLKAGRLGIGTSEPRGALDVRGDAYYGCPVFFTAYYGNSGTNNNIAAGSSPNYTTLVFNYTMVNKGGAYNLSTGRCTFPISGYYEVLFRGGSASTAGCQTWIFRNGVAPTTWTASGLKSVGAAWDSSSGTFRNLGIIHFFDYFEAGEYLDVRIVSGSFNASNYNSFSVKYLSN